jgi:hypothetical protein
MNQKILEKKNGAVRVYAAHQKIIHKSNVVLKNKLYNHIISVN